MEMGFCVLWLSILLVSSSSAKAIVHGRSDVCEGLPGLRQCSMYLLGGVPTPDANCCNAVAWLSKHASTRKDRVELCKCLKIEDYRHKGVDLDRAKALPGQCHVHLPVPLIPDGIDCDKIKAVS